MKMISSKQSERIEKNLEDERKVINRYLGLKKLRKEGKEIRENYLSLMREYYETNYELDNEDTDQKRYFESKSTVAKRIILDEIGGELLDVRCNGAERDKGIRFDELGELERKLDSPELPKSAALSKSKYPINAFPRKIDVSEHERGYRMSVEYVDSKMWGEDEPIGRDIFDIFAKQLLGENILFLRFDTPVGESLTSYGGAWGLAGSSTTYELDRYGGLVAIQKLDENSNSKEIAKSIVDRCIQRIKDYMLVEKERSVRGLHAIMAYRKAKQLLGKDYSEVLRLEKKKLKELE
jgi:hypothetical protein